LNRGAGVPAVLPGPLVRHAELLPIPEAVREAVVNALVHRDYLLSATNIELSLYADRMEIISPGRLPNGITPARMLVGCRAPRNQLLKDVMKDYRCLEHAGMGIPRKIVKCMQEHNDTTREQAAGPPSVIWVSPPCPACYVTGHAGADELSANQDSAGLPANCRSFTQ
jgi:ATP-dependent DNA helicase RecG